MLGIDKKIAIALVGRGIAISTTHGNKLHAPLICYDTGNTRPPWPIPKSKRNKYLKSK